MKNFLFGIPVTRECGKASFANNIFLLSSYFLLLLYTLAMLFRTFKRIVNPHVFAAIGIIFFFINLGSIISAIAAFLLDAKNLECE